MRSTVIADYSEARRIADDFGVGVPEDAGCGGIGGAPLDNGVARASRPWTIMLLQQSAFFKLRTTARHDRCQPLRRCRATSPCRGGFSCRENVSAVVLRPCTTSRHARRQPPPTPHAMTAKPSPGMTSSGKSRWPPPPTCWPRHIAEMAELPPDRSTGRECRNASLAHGRCTSPIGKVCLLQWESQQATKPHLSLGT